MNDTATRARASVPEYPMRSPMLQWRAGLAQVRIDAHADFIAEAAHREREKLAQQARKAVEAVVQDWLNGR